MEHLQRYGRQAAHKRQRPRQQTASGKVFLTQCRLTAALVLLEGMFLSGPFIQGAQASGKSTVLLLNANRKGLGWTDDVTRAVESILNGHELHVEYMDTKRHADECYLNLFQDLMFKKYKHLKVDVIISSDDYFLSFLVENRDSLFPGVPIVFCGVNDYSESLLAAHTRITGVVEAFDIRQTIGMALHLHPSSEKLVIVNDTTKTGLAKKKVIERLLPEFSGQVEFDFLESMTMPDLLSKLQQLPLHTIVLLMSFNRDAAGRVFDYDTSIKFISEKCGVSIYGIWDFYLGKGLVGGKLTSGRTQGEAAATIALKIINGARADAIPVITQSHNRRMFDDRQLARVINFLPDPTFVIDRHGRVIAWNRAIEALTGVKADSMLGKGKYEYAVPFYGERRPVMIDLDGGWNDQIANHYRDIKKKGDLLFSETLEPGG